MEVDGDLPCLVKLQDIESEVSDMSWGSFKEVLSDSLIECLGPIQVSRALPFRQQECCADIRDLFFFFVRLFSSLAEAIRRNYER